MNNPAEEQRGFAPFEKSVLILAYLLPLASRILAGGLDLPLKPFFGVMGVAPPPAWGRITSLIPRAIGGNLDNKELTAGTTLFLPGWAPGALFSAGDGHGVQGDGEVCINALEICLTGTFTLILHKNPSAGRGSESPPANSSALAKYRM